MNPDFTSNLKKITITGEVLVERVSKFRSKDGSAGFAVFVLLGPTGSGKSTFIESLAPNISLDLSSDKLEGFTQSISIYRIMNVRIKYRIPIYIVDVPGFADSKISAMGIVSMLKNMIQANEDLYVFRILYFTPINHPRLPGSQRRVLRTFEALTGPRSAGRITIVSTMWDLVWNESASRRAKTHFIQLQDKVWNGYIANGAIIVKFHNTQESGLTILNEAFSHFRGADFELQKSVSQPLRQTPVAVNLYTDIQARIQDLQMQQANIRSDLQEATEILGGELKDTLTSQLKEVQMLVEKFEHELSEFGPAPISPPATEPAEPTAAISPKGFFRRVIDSFKGFRTSLT